MAEEKKNSFNELYSINVNKFVEKKNTGKVQLSYLSWPYAWKEIKSRFPDATYEVVKFENGLPYTYDKNTGYMVYTRVTIEGITHEMWLPVMDSHNAAMLSEAYTVKTKYNSYTVEKCTMFDVNKTIMRCLTKNLAMFGLGLYIYAGEDLPVTDEESSSQQKSQTSNAQKTPKFPETEESKQLKNSILDWINDDTISDKKTLAYAEDYMFNNDVAGMKQLAAWCQSQQKPA